MDQYGILAAELYIPKLYIDQKDFEISKNISRGKITIGLSQKQMSFVSHLEDVNSIALSVLRKLLTRTKIPEKQISKLEFGTETLHDKSKSTKTILMQLFKNNKNIEGVTNINACYGGTAALLNCLSWGKGEGRGKYSIVVMADIAVYDSIAAQPTGGVGAIALLLGPNPVIKVERNRISHFENAYDFYKPNLDKEFPVVNGKLSTALYNRVLLSVYEKLLIKYKEEGETIDLSFFDFFCFHCPFAKQVEKGFLKLYFNDIMKGRIKSDEEDFTEFFKENPNFNERIVQKNLREILTKNKFFEKLDSSLDLNRKIGNIYTGSLYLSLVSLILKKENKDLLGKRIFMYSYGSGCAASIFSLKIKNNFNKNIFLDVNAINYMMDARIKVKIEEFEHLNLRRSSLYNKNNIENKKELKYLWDDSYYLHSVDDFGKRSYIYIKSKNIKLENHFLDLKKIKKEKKFRNKSIQERRDWLSSYLNKKIDRNFENGGLSYTQGNMLIENFVGGISLPLGMALNFKVNGKSLVIPMVTEEPSVIAAASYSAKLICSNSYGFRAVSTRNIMRGQMFLKNLKVTNPLSIFIKEKDNLINYGNMNLCKTMFERGGGISDLHLKQNLDSKRWVLDVLIDVKDSMGANTINTVLEGLAPKMKGLLKANVIMNIVTNLAPERIVKSCFEIPVVKLKTKNFSGKEVAKRIVEANDIAKTNIFRACTHNKGIMNGIDAVCLAVGQDIRAIEASCHVYSIYKYGHYRCLTNYFLSDNGKILRGEIEIPFTIGTKGGSTNSNEIYKLNLEILGNPNSRQLGLYAVSLGLAQNFAALKALVTVGIQKGHMSLHAKHVAIESGIAINDVPQAVLFMMRNNMVSIEGAREFLKFKNKQVSLNPKL